MRLKGVNLDQCHSSKELRNSDNIAQSLNPRSILSSYSVLPSHHLPSQNKDLEVIFQKLMWLSESTNLQAYHMHLERAIDFFLFRYSFRR